MVLILVSILSFFFLIYSFWLFALTVNIRIVPSKSLNEELTQYPQIDLLIPFRNERANLPVLLKSIAGLSYPKDKLSVILVNDHSEDGYQTDLTALLKQFPFQLQFLDLPQHFEGKKQALSFGLGYCKGDLVVFTDADCSFESVWLESYAEAFSKTPFDLSFGAVHIKGKGWLAKFQQAEHYALSGVSFGMALFKKPVMISAANMCLRRAFLEILKPKEDLFGAFISPSGDDMFLLNKVILNAGLVKGLVGPGSVVQTNAIGNVPEFIQQRIRWASKWKNLSNPFYIFTGLIVLFINFSVLSLLILVFLKQELIYFSIMLLGMKAISEYLLLTKTASITRKNLSVSSFVLLFCFYPFYCILMFGLSLSPEIKWKGRQHLRI
jgi:poly-beta-1,6-N-acetyl-D-glucosamine synthase